MFIPMTMIKAAIPCAGEKGVRYYLNGANFTYTASDKRLRVISTDGSIMSCFSVYLPECEEVDYSVTIPIETLKLAAKVKAPGLELTAGALGQFLFKPVEGKFPDYRRVIPASVDGTPGDYQPELLQRATNALRAYYGTKCAAYQLDQNGMGGAVMHNGENDAMVVIMPMRVTDKNNEREAYRGFI